MDISNLKKPMLNSEMTWYTKEKYPKNTPFWALVEEDTHRPEQHPSILKIIFLPDNPPGQRRKLVDFDKDRQKEYLQPHLTIVAWRYLTS